MAPPLLRVEGLTKRFPGVVALKGVSFDLRPGELHALCGENGAGKSTLIKILSGIHPHGSYEGTVWTHGEQARFQGAADAQARGIAVIYQELALVPGMSVAENVFLGSEPRRRGLVDWPRTFREARELLARFGVSIDPESRAEALGTGRQQLVEIVKALRRDSRVLILDEPTAALTEAEVRTLLDILRGLKARGIGCVYVSHRLEEVFAVSDRITVLRDGASVVTLETARTNKAEVVRHMVGREISDFFPRRSGSPGRTLLRASGLTVEDPLGRSALKDVSFEVRAGEVLGFGGLMGSGRSELLMHIFGAWGRRLAGTVELDGSPLPQSPRQALRRGLALVSEDRKRFGLVLDKGVGFNLSLSSLGAFARSGFIDASREREANQRSFSSLRVKAPGLEAAVGSLSGGNQQKVVVGKALMTGPKVVFLDEPTRGVDVGAKLEIYEIINRLTDEGKAVVLVSSELPELIGMSDRILMLHEGSVGGRFAKGETDQEKLLAAAMGLPDHG